MDESSLVQKAHSMHRLLRTPTLPLLAALATPLTAQDCWRPDSLETGGSPPALVHESSYSGLTLNYGGAGTVGDHSDRYRVVLPPYSRLTLDFDAVSSLPSEPYGLPTFKGGIYVGGGLQHFFFIGGTAGSNGLFPPVFENPGSAPLDVEIDVSSDLLRSAGCMEYEMHVALDRRPCDVQFDDALEGPDDCASALVLAPGSYSDLVVFGAGRRAGDDVDAYRIPNVAPGESVRVGVLPRDPANDRLFVRLTDDATCTGSPTIAGTHFERNDSAAPVDYYLQLEADSPWDFVRYDLLVERIPDACAALQPDAFEPNDLCATAAAITAGVYGNLTLDEAGDLFEVAVPADHTLIARVSTTDPDVEPWVSISSAASCPRNYASAEASLSVGGAPETLRVGVQAFGVPCGDYALEIELVPAPCTAAAGNGSHEPNDTCATAATVPLVLSPDGFAAGQVHTSASDADDDYYRVTVPAGSFLDVSLTGGVELTAFPAADCSATPLVGTTAGPGLVSTLLPAREGAAVEYVIGVTVPNGAVGCMPYILRFNQTGSCGLIPLAPEGAWWEAQASDCNAPLAVAPGVFNDLMLRPGQSTVCAIDVGGGGSLEVSFLAGQLQNQVGVPISVRFHDGANDCAASGASLASAVFAPGDPNPSLQWINHGLGRTVFVEVGFAPGVSSCGALDVIFDLGDGAPFTADCMPAPQTPVPCPCGNNAVPTSGGGCANSTGNSGRLAATGSASVSLDDFRPRVQGLAVDVPGILLRRTAEPHDQAHPFYDGVLCIGFQPQVVSRFVTGASGDWQGVTPLAGSLGVAPGAVDRFQVWYRDRGGPCGSGANTTNSIRVEWE